MNAAGVYGCAHAGSVNPALWARRATVVTTVAAPTASAEDGESPAAARQSLRAALQRMMPGVFDRSMEPVAPAAHDRATADELMQPPPKRKVGVAHATHATHATPAAATAAAFVDALGLVVLPVGCAESEAAATPRNGQVLEEEADDEGGEAESEAGSGEARSVGEVEEELEVEAPAVAVVTEAEGLRLHLSSNGSTGYKNVVKDGSRFKAEYRAGEREVYIGSFDTAVEAAVAYARAVEEMQGERPAKERRLNEMQGERPAKEQRLNRVGLAYQCARCGLPKRGHVCTLPPAKWARAPHALETLEQVFKDDKFPSVETRKNLATELRVTPRQVQVWFQNKRQRSGAKPSSSPRVPWEPSVPAMPPPPPPAKDVAALAAAAASAMIASYSCPA